MQRARSWAKGVVMTGLGLALLGLDFGTASAGSRAATGAPPRQQTLQRSGSQSAPTADIQQIDTVSRGQIESILLDAAQRAGVAARPGTLIRASSPGFQVDALATQEAERWTLEDLGRGVETHFLFLSQRRAGFEGGFYLQRLRIDDPQDPKAMKLELLDLDGRTVGSAENVEMVLKILDGGPGPGRKEECTESWGWGVNSDGEECTNYVRVCTDSEFPFVGGASVEQWCLVVVE